jgi:predicted nucleotidyltransferase
MHVETSRELRSLLQTHRDAILALAAHYGASNVRVFGSIARGETHAASDVDVLVTLADDRSLLDLVGLWQDLEELLQCRVDVVSERGLNERIRERVLRDAVAL